MDKALALLDADFRHPGLRSHPVESAPGVIEAYVDRKYRMTFERHGDTFIMRNVDNHDECLRQAMRPTWPVGISLENGKLIIKQATKSNLTLKQLLAKINEENLHPEVDTGLTAGNETW